MKSAAELAALRREFMKYAELEPRLLDLEQQIRRITSDTQHDATFCAADWWYGYHGKRGIRPQLNKLVGYEVHNGAAELMTQAAHHACYRYLYESLPDDRE